MKARQAYQVFPTTKQ